MTASDQLSVEFNPATEEGTSELLPKGSYVARIIDAVIQPFKSGKGRGVFLTWELVDDAYAGRKLWSNCTIVHESEKAMKFGRQKFKDVADACGLTESFKDLTLLYDKPCLIAVAIEEDADGKYPPKNVIVRVKPIPQAKKKGNETNGADPNDEVSF
jgi:hypothetical protein